MTIDPVIYAFISNGITIGFFIGFLTGVAFSFVAFRIHQ